MPNYTYVNDDTGEEITIQMTMTEHETYLDDKPGWRQIIKTMSVVDPVGLGISKPPSDFMKGVIGRMKESIPQANKAALEKRWHVPREW